MIVNCKGSGRVIRLTASWVGLVLFRNEKAPQSPTEEGWVSSFTSLPLSKLPANAYPWRQQVVAQDIQETRWRHMLLALNIRKIQNLIYWNHIIGIIFTALCINLSKYIDHLLYKQNIFVKTHFHSYFLLNNNFLNRNLHEFFGYIVSVLMICLPISIFISINCFISVFVPPFFAYGTYRFCNMLSSTIYKCV